MFQYNPGIVYHGDEALAEGAKQLKNHLINFALGMAMPSGSDAAAAGEDGGISFGKRLGAGAKSAAEGFQDYSAAGDKFKAVQDDAKSADSFFKANPDALTKQGIHPEQYKTYSAAQKVAARDGFIKAQGVQEVGLRIKSFMEQMAADKSAQDAISSVQPTKMPRIPVGAGYAPAGDMGSDTVQPGFMDYFQALAKAPGAMGAPAARNTLSMLNDYDRTSGTKRPKGLTFLKSPSGADIIMSPDTGAFQVDPLSKLAAQEEAAAKRPPKGAVTPQDEFKELAKSHLFYESAASKARLANQPDIADQYQSKADDYAQQITEFKLPAAEKSKVIDVMGIRARVPGNATVGAASAATPTPAAVAHLKAHPELAADYDAKYGVGAAAAILGK